MVGAGDVRQNCGTLHPAHKRRRNAEVVDPPAEITSVPFNGTFFLQSVWTECSSSRVIRTFSCKETERLFRGFTVRVVPPDILRRARTKLLVLHSATNLDDLKSPPGNRLEALTGDRKGQHSVRINQQYRLCFRWSEQGAEDVEITDYH